MRASHCFIATLREKPSDAELISHQLMLRAGLIRKLASGLYTWLPLGLRVLRKVEAIVREEMNAIAGMEVLMPAIQPAELWQETGRWETFGGQLLTMKDASGRDYCFGPTHEEVITDLVRHEVRSYKHFPATFYQIQTKFRDEIRPRFGLMRAREFLMKDAYSFHLSQECLEKTYADMYGAYSQIFTRLGLKFRVVEADTGAIGGSKSHEFQVLADSGEDLIFFSDESDYAANVEQARSLIPPPAEPAPEKALAMESFLTPNLKTIEELCTNLKIQADTCIKTLIVEGSQTPLIALVLKADDELNEIKAAKHPLVKSPLVFADEESIINQLGVEPGFIGPVGLGIPVLVDHSALAMSSFICGANVVDHHYRHVYWQRDAFYQEACDLRKVKEGDLSPDSQGRLRSCRGIEVGHVFQLGDKYARAMKAEVLDDEGSLKTLTMGCYGIGVSRVVAAAIEQHHDERGILWPAPMAPFQVVLIPINAERSVAVKELAETLYQDLQKAGFEILYEDRQERPGVLFADSDLIGIPHRLVVSEKHLKQGLIEYKARAHQEVEFLSLDNLVEALKEKL